MPTPEQKARQQIDHLLTQAGWQVQDRAEMDLSAALGVAVREYSLNTGYADYLLFVDRKPIGAVEAKAEGTTLTGVEPQSAKYGVGLPASLPAWRRPLPFLYESTGIETYFTDGRDPDPRSRRVFAFHKPETLRAWVQEAQSLRARLRAMPPLITGNLWGAQIEAITNLERSFADNRPRALIQMATGSGKTFTAVNFIYRLIKHANAERVLFLVDRSNLGRQTLKEFQQFITPDDGRKFTELYNVQHLRSNRLDRVSKVHITTIQRLYSILQGQPEFDAELEEGSLFEQSTLLDREPMPVVYNPNLPLEYYDFIVTDECHRSIYNLWRQVLEYFDSFLIGLTATPSKQTFGFFKSNLVMEYSRQRAVADGVNVEGQVYRIRTQITETGSTVSAGFFVGRRDRRTRQERWEQLDDDFDYDAGALDERVTTDSQIRTIIQTYRDRLFTEIFPGRTEVPKTLIFAKDDHHAEEIVRIVREEFGKGNEFCQKITYKVTGVKPEDLIASFRNSYHPRIAVTVDMIATGTDIKPLEVLLFMRPVRSRLLYEQMLGRGTRVISQTDLQAVTKDATAKDRFVIVDVLGVVESDKVDLQMLDRKRSVKLDKLIELVQMGVRDEDTLSTLAARLANVQKKVTAQDDYDLAAVLGGEIGSLRGLTNRLLDAIDPDQIEAKAGILAGDSRIEEQHRTQAAAQLAQAATAPFDKPAFRNKLREIQSRNEITLDQVSQDHVLVAGFSEGDTQKARETVQSFRQYIEANKDEITALRILFDQPRQRQRLTFEQIKDLAAHLEQPNGWTTESLWRAFLQLEQDKVRGATSPRILADLVSLVRHAVQLDNELVPYPDRVRQRYAMWVADLEAQGKTFTPEQRWWLDEIAKYVGVNLSISMDDFEDSPFFERGGRFGALRVLGDGVNALIEELNFALAQ